MDPVLYKAAAAGNIDPFNKIDPACLDRILTPDENTILHVYLRIQRWEWGSTAFVPALLLQANKKGETPLHLAAKYGHSNVVKVLIARAKAPFADPESGVTAARMMLRMTNGEGETALHEAARKARSRVVGILTKEDPDFSYSANVHGETPLYIAASVGRGPEQGKVIDKILRNCSEVDHVGPNGRTALHAAITARDHVRKLLEKEKKLANTPEEKKLAKTTDENGWSPLHYVSYFSGWIDISAVKVLLEYDASATYIAETTEKKRTTLHIAAIQGHVDVMKEIVSRCPDCCELVDNRGWNALHYAVASQSSNAFKKCLSIPELERLKIEKDDKGNTPFHLVAALTHNQKEWRAVYPNEKSIGIYSLNKQKQSIASIRCGDFGEIQGDTALHEAARKARSHVVGILTKEDPDFSYSANVHGETPLYIAASVGFCRRQEQGKVIDKILRNCSAVDYGGPNGRTALHAAITARDHVTVRKLLEKEKKLAKTTDENGWSPLHYAAYFSGWIDISAVKVLLEYDASAAYIAETTEKERIALHIAVIQGHVDVMKEIVSRCPDCCELVDNRGWNALHYAVASQSSIAFKECLRIP
uniref:Uncharacterized protein n=1 Tax=Salix viminalis TaxID=40686 RepID=A0A6N2LTD5_SALVM